MELTIKNIYKNSDGRWRAYCTDEFGKSHIVSYPRLLMEQKIGRPLKPDEDIHHIDGNPDNNDISNLKIIMHGEHQKQHSIKYIDTFETCMICGKYFIMTAKEWSRFFGDLNRSQPTHRILTCSKSCAGKASSGKYKYLYDLNQRLNEVKKLWLK